MSHATVVSLHEPYLRHIDPYSVIARTWNVGNFGFGDSPESPLDRHSRHRTLTPHGRSQTCGANKMRPPGNFFPKRYSTYRQSVSCESWKMPLRAVCSQAGSEAVAGNSRNLLPQSRSNREERFKGLVCGTAIMRSAVYPKYTQLPRPPSHCSAPRLGKRESGLLRASVAAAYDRPRVATMPRLA